MRMKASATCRPPLLRSGLLMDCVTTSTLIPGSMRTPLSFFILLVVIKNFGIVFSVFISLTVPWWGCKHKKAWEPCCCFLFHNAQVSKWSKLDSRNMHRPYLLYSYAYDIALVRVECKCKQLRCKAVHHCFSMTWVRSLRVRAPQKNVSNAFMLSFSIEGMCKFSVYYWDMQEGKEKSCSEPKWTSNL